MSRLCLLISISLVLHLSWACDDNEEELLAGGREDPEDYYAYAYGFTPETWRALYQQPTPRARVPEYSGLYEGRTPSRLHTFTNPLKSKKKNADKEHRQPEGRFAFGGLGANLINTGFFNSRFTPSNTWKPFQNLASRIPISYNPNADSPFDTFESCMSPNGDAGICAPGSVCSLFGGRPGGSCILGKVCCINTINKCGGTVTLNNTYWQSSTFPINVPTTCSLSVRTDTQLTEQLKKPICQIRLDFITFTTAQPTAGTCTDTFKVGQTNSKVPTICGDNGGQHMYLDIPSSAVTPSNVQLMFTFSEETAVRSWNIKIALLPCGAFYLAPVDCLQYFTAATGRVRSFNWLDTNSTTIRQLNNQNYNICFRTELIAGLTASELCLSVCSVTNGDAFSITTPISGAIADATAAVATAQANLATAQAVQAAAAAAFLAANGGNTATANQIQTLTNANVALAAAQAALTTAQAALTAAVAAAGTGLSAVGTSTNATGVITATCLYDSLLIPGARDSMNVEADRYCGDALNPAFVPVGTSVQVCTPLRPFKMTYRTDSTEAAIAAGTNILPARADINNTGFCLNFQEK
ncbi:uncharacterized protein LOC124205594 [Daphnia pulex]|uniref:uncharacterized protein LOC124205594 n=1 Tax=Daphnia pulex TaxID=6669 RepID=UPI001EDEBE78|nr:uncharacterized protein LOC124205594 [Daphnia pulex]XP_046459001.1 uncharacterized protein LOC124205594 [Daphnia pulex]XP_046459003.1 uncharacterized protein LOC124205594 [Daphnia pulex]XP_046459004.1 uncharacterized protein LOC124205594 [Daphnia pulex]